MPEMVQNLFLVFSFYLLLFLAVNGQPACIGTDYPQQGAVNDYQIDSFPGLNGTQCIAACCANSECAAVMIPTGVGDCTLVKDFPQSAVFPDDSFTVHFLVRNPAEYYLDLWYHNSEECTDAQPVPRSYPINSCLTYGDLAYSEHTYELFEMVSFYSTTNFTVRHLVWYEAPGCTVSADERPQPDVIETEGLGCYHGLELIGFKSAPYFPPDTPVTTPDTYQPAYVYWRRSAEDYCAEGPPKQVSHALGQCYQEESLTSSFKFERAVTDPYNGYQMEMTWWEESIDCSGNASEVFNVTWGCRVSGTGQGSFTFGADPINQTCSSATTSALNNMKLADQFQVGAWPSLTSWDSCYQMCCSIPSCLAFAVGPLGCSAYSAMGSPEFNSLYDLYQMIPTSKTNPVLFLQTSTNAATDCSGAQTDTATYPLEFCSPYSGLAYNDHAYQLLSIDIYSASDAFTLQQKVWFEAPGCTVPADERPPPDMERPLIGGVCYGGTTYTTLTYAPISVPSDPILAPDMYQPLYVNWRRYVSGGACSSGPPQVVSYMLGVCYEYVGERSTFKFERTATHPVQGYQMAVTWWSNSSTCDGAGTAMFNVTWGCRSVNPARGYFTFDSDLTLPICDGATSTIGLRQTGVDQAFVIAVPFVRSWDGCFGACCSSADCVAFTLSTNFVCNLYQNFTSEAITSNPTQTLYYMVRDGFSASPGYVNTRSYNRVGCNGGVSSYQSLHAGTCIPYTRLQYKEHAYQIMYFESYDGINSYSLRHRIWYTPPGCTVSPEEQSAPDVDIVRSAGDCDQGLNFWTAQYAPYTYNVSQTVDEPDFFIPLYVNRIEYKGVDCSPPVAQSVSYELGVCYAEGTDSFLVLMTSNHPQFGYQMNISRWNTSIACDGIPDVSATLVWGCNSLSRGYFSFTDIPEFPIFEYVESSSMMPVPTTSILPTSMIEPSLSMQTETVFTSQLSSSSPGVVTTSVVMTSAVSSSSFSSAQVETSSFISSSFVTMLESSTLPSVSSSTLMSGTSSQLSMVQVTSVPSISAVSSMSFQTSIPPSEMLSSSFVTSVVSTGVSSDLQSSTMSVPSMSSSASSSPLVQFSSSPLQTSPSASTASSPLLSATSELSLFPSTTTTTSPVVQSSSSSLEMSSSQSFSSSAPTSVSSAVPPSTTTTASSMSQSVSSPSSSSMPTTTVVMPTTTSLATTSMTMSTTVVSTTTAPSTSSTTSTMSTTTMSTTSTMSTTTMSTKSTMSTTTMSTSTMSTTTMSTKSTMSAKSTMSTTAMSTTTTTASSPVSLSPSLSASMSPSPPPPPSLDDSHISAAAIAVEVVVPVGVLFIILFVVTVIAVFIVRRGSRKGKSLPISMTFTNVSVGDFDEAIDHDMAPLKAHLVLDPNESGGVGGDESMFGEDDMDCSLV